MIQRVDLTFQVIEPGRDVSILWLCPTQSYLGRVALVRVVLVYLWRPLFVITYICVKRATRSRRRLESPGWPFRIYPPTAAFGRNHESPGIGEIPGRPGRLTIVALLL